MCVILSIDDLNFTPSDKMLNSCEDSNPEGGGIAWIENDKVHFKKDITAKEIKDLIKDRAINPPYLIHFRIRSSGAVCPELCHPFPFDKKLNDKLEGITSKGVLFHNGTWMEWDSMLLKTCVNMGCKIPDGELSDSKVMAFLTEKYGYNFPQLIDTSGRIAILTPKGITKFGNWKTVNDISCSNDYFVPKTNYNIGYSNIDNHGDWCNCYYCEDEIKRKYETKSEKVNDEAIIDLDTEILDESEKMNKENYRQVKKELNDNYNETKHSLNNAIKKKKIELKKIITSMKYTSNPNTMINPINNSIINKTIINKQNKPHSNIKLYEFCKWENNLSQTDYAIYEYLKNSGHSENLIYKFALNGMDLDEINDFLVYGDFVDSWKNEVIGKW